MRVGLAQIDIIWENKEENKLKCLELLKEAKASGVELIIFPEMTLTGFSMNVEAIAEDHHESLDWFRKAADEYDIHIGFGHVAKAVMRGKNQFSIVSPDGQEKCRYTKIHPFSYGKENEFYESGVDLAFTEVGGVNLSTFICYDLRFPEIFQIASYRSEAIIVSANWPAARREHWLTLLKARAIETQSYIIGVNRVGEGDGIQYSGDSVVFDPYGNMISELSDKEGLIVSDIDIKEVTKLRQSFTLKKDRRESLYRNSALQHNGGVYYQKALLKGKNIVLTGACGLLGREIARGVAEFGGNVIVADINEKEAEKLSSEINQTYNVNSAPFALNITSEASVEDMIVFLEKEYGAVHALINCAYPRNKAYGTAYENISFDSWRENIDLHLNGYFNVSQKVSKLMMKQNYGRIVNFGSIYGFLGPDFSIYSGTSMTMPAEYSVIKGGIINFTRYLATYLGKYNINVNCISPGGIANNQADEFVKRYEEKTPLGRLGSTSDIVGGVIYLISDLSAYVTGHNLVIDGGWSVW